MWADVESNIDYLNFGEVSSLAVDILKSENMLPVSIGIFGNWGAGKSSLLKIIEKQINQEDGKDILVVNFDAWLYQGYDDARALHYWKLLQQNLTKQPKETQTL